MNAKSQLHTVVDAVRALHMLKPKSFNKQWLVMGHSQGGCCYYSGGLWSKRCSRTRFKRAIALRQAVINMKALQNM